MSSSSTDFNGTNIILNHDFSLGLHSWKPNCCKASVINADSGISHGGLDPSKCGRYVVVTNRKEFWQGLEQDITSRVKLDCLYKVSATVAVYGNFKGLVDVTATVKIEYKNSPTKFQSISRSHVCEETWVRLEGMFSVSSSDIEKIVFYLEGPPAGTDLCILSVTIHPKSDIENPENTVRNSQLSDCWFLI